MKDRKNKNNQSGASCDHARLSKDHDSKDKKTQSYQKYQEDRWVEIFTKGGIHMG